MIRNQIRLNAANQMSNVLHEHLKMVTKNKDLLKIVISTKIKI